MDEKSTVGSQTIVGKGFTDDCILYRLLHRNHLDKKNKEIRANCFDPEVDGLSTDWNRYCDPEQILIRTGLTYRFKTIEYKDPQKYSLITLSVREIRAIQEISDIVHTPTFRNPERIGSPNNPAHTSVFYIDEEVRMELKKIAKHIAEVDRDKINLEIEKLRANIKIIENKSI